MQFSKYTFICLLCKFPYTNLFRLQIVPVATKSIGWWIVYFYKHFFNCLKFYIIWVESAYSEAAQGLFVPLQCTMHLHMVFTITVSITGTYNAVVTPFMHYTNYVSLSCYLRTVIVTAAVCHFGSPGRRRSLYNLNKKMAVTCVFGKQSLRVWVHSLWLLLAIIKLQQSCT